MQNNTSTDTLEENFSIWKLLANKNIKSLNIRFSDIVTKLWHHHNKDKRPPMKKKNEQ